LPIIICLSIIKKIAKFRNLPIIWKFSFELYSWWHNHFVEFLFCLPYNEIFFPNLPYMKKKVYIPRKTGLGGCLSQLFYFAGKALFCLIIFLGPCKTDLRGALSRFIVLLFIPRLRSTHPRPFFFLFLF